MPDELPFIYWDACVFLSYVEGMKDRLPHIDAILEKSGKDHQIITSTISIVEVAFAKTEKDGRVLDPSIEAKINRLWTPTSPIRLEEFYPQIAETAKGLLRHAISQGWSLKPMDAIHLSTARIHNVTAMHTYSEDLRKWKSHLGFEIGPPIASSPKLPL